MRTLREGFWPAKARTMTLTAFSQFMEGLFTCSFYLAKKMKRSLSTTGRSESKWLSFALVAVGKFASGLWRLTMFACGAASWTAGSQMDQEAVESNRQLSARERKPKPQFIGGPLDGMEAFSLDSPSQEFYFPSSRVNPGRFAYYVVHGGNWEFIGWRTREQVMAGG